jgi:hypothetical protein
VDTEQDFLLCAACGDRIGVYERVGWQQPDGTMVFTGSRVVEEHRGNVDGPSRVYHVACAAPALVSD